IAPWLRVTSRDDRWLRPIHPKVVQSFRGSESQSRLEPQARRPRGNEDPRAESGSPSPVHFPAATSQTERYPHQPRRSENCSLLFAHQALHSHLLIKTRSLLPISRIPSVNNNTASAGDSTLKGCERS